VHTGQQKPNLRCKNCYRQTANLSPQPKWHLLLVQLFLSETMEVFM